MNSPRLSASNPSDTPSLGGYSLDEFDDVSDTAHVSAAGRKAESQAQYHIIVKRNDGLFRTLNILTTVFSVIAVLLVVASFVAVFYSLMTITEVAEMMSEVKEHNALVVPTK